MCNVNLALAGGLAGFAALALVLVRDAVKYRIARWALS